MLGSRPMRPQAEWLRPPVPIVGEIVSLPNGELMVDVPGFGIWPLDPFEQIVWWRESFRTFETKADWSAEDLGPDVVTSCHYCGELVGDEQARAQVPTIPVVHQEFTCPCEPAEAAMCPAAGSCFTLRIPRQLRPLHWDHKTPKARGGSNDPVNLVAACSRCNQQKGTRPYLDFLLDRPDQRDPEYLAALREIRMPNA